jgi:hypothetical protein
VGAGLFGHTCAMALWYALMPDYCPYLVGRMHCSPLTTSGSFVSGTMALVVLEFLGTMVACSMSLQAGTTIVDSCELICKVALGFLIIALGKSQSQ